MSVEEVFKLRETESVHCEMRETDSQGFSRSLILCGDLDVEMCGIFDFGSRAFASEGESRTRSSTRSACGGESKDGKR